jgi:hypothetical protein
LPGVLLTALRRLRGLGVLSRLPNRAPGRFLLLLDLRDDGLTVAIRASDWASGLAF